MRDHEVRFHQAVAFLPTRQILPMAKACDGLGYGGMYVSDHLFNPRQRDVALHLLEGRGRRPGLGGPHRLARPHVRHCSLCGRNGEPALHHRHLHRPAAGPHDGGQDRRHDRRPVGQPAAPRHRRRLEQGGVRPDGPGLRQPRQAPRRNDRRPARPVARRLGRVPRRLLRRPGVPDGARPHRAGAVHLRRPLPRRAAAHRRAVRRLDRRRRLQRGGGLDAPRRAARRAARRPDATRTASPSTCRSTSGRASTSTAASPTPA